MKAFTMLPLIIEMNIITVLSYLGRKIFLIIKDIMLGMTKRYFNVHFYFNYLIVI